MRIKKSAALTGAVALLGGAVVYAQHFSWPFKSGVTTAQTAQSKSDVGQQLWHCGMHPQVIWDHPGLCPICHMPLTPFAGGQHLHGQITVDPTIVQNMGVRTAKAMRGPLSVTIQASGVLKIPEPAVYEIAPKTTGWITHLYADTEGMHVHKGDVLFDFYSPDLESAATELIHAVRALKAIGSDSGEQRRDLEEQVAGARQRLIVRDVADRDVDAVAALDRAPASIPIRSPASGVVMEKMVVQGSSVASGTKLMRIEEHVQLWLDAEVFEDQMQAISIGEPVTATFDALPGRSFSGKVSLVYPHVDEATRTEIVRTVMESPDLALKPGMYAMVNIITRPLADALLIPREAVIDSGTRQVVFVATDGGHFDARIVHMGMTGDNDQVQILDGINEGDMVVTSGQFLLDVESRTLEAIDKLRRPDGGSGGEMLQPSGGMKGSMP